MAKLNEKQWLQKVFGHLHLKKKNGICKKVMLKFSLGEIFAVIYELKKIILCSKCVLVLYLK